MRTSLAAGVGLTLAILACSAQHPPPAPAGPMDGSADATVAADGSASQETGADAPIDGGLEAAPPNADAGPICSDPSPGLPDADVAPSPALCPDSPPWVDAGAPAVQLRVDASASGAPWSRFYEKVVASDHANTLLCTSWHRNIQRALRRGHAQAGFQFVRFHGILDDDIGVYSEDASGSPVYRWARFDAVYDAIAAAGMRPIVEISFMPKALASDPSQILTNLNYNSQSPNISPPKDWTRWSNFMTAIVTHLEQRYGVDEVRNWYFEVWNEPSWMYSMGGAGYNQLYKFTVTGLLQGDPQLRVGGPAGTAGESITSVPSLVAYANFYHLKLDFISYHRYADDDAPIADANVMLAYHQRLSAIVSGTGFSGELLNDEFGPSWKPDISRDNESSASFIAKTIHLIGTDTVAAPPHSFGYWTISDLYEEVYHGTSTAFNEGNFGLLLKGDPRFPESFDVPKPAFNAFRLLHMMGDVQLSVSGGTTADGVNALGTISADASSMQILVYNHVTGALGDPTKSSLVAVSIDNIPFAPGPVRVRQYVVDHTHANAYTAWVGMNKPAVPTQAQWSTLRDAAEPCYYETTVNLAGSSWTVTFPQNVYGVSLISLTR